MIKSLWLRVGGPNAVSFMVWLTLSPIAILGSYLSFLRDVPEGTTGLLFLVSVVSYFPSGVVLGVAWLTYLSPKIERKSRPKLAVVTFLAAGFSTGLSFATLLDLAGLQESPDYLGISLTRAFIGLYWSTLMALVMDSHRAFASQAEALTAAIEASEEIAKARESAVDALRVDLIEKVRSTINIALNVKNRADLDRAADQIVRPLVDALRSKGVAIPQTRDSQLRKINIKPVVFDALANPSMPLLVGLWATLSNLVASVRWLAPATLLNLVVVCVLIATTLAVIKRFKPRPAVMFGLYGLGAAASVMSAEFFQQLAPENARLLANLNLGSWVVALFISGFIKFEAERAQVLGRLRATLDEAQWNQDRLQQELWVERTRLMRYVHGTIQSRIRAAAARSGDLTDEQVERLKSDCLSMLDEEVSPVSFEEFIGQTRRVWDGILKIQAEVPDQVLNLLNQDSFANAAAIETVREGVLNAVRHGKAKNVRLKLQLVQNPQGRVLKLRLENDGNSIDPKGDSGFGSTVLDDSTASWGLENFEGGVALNAEIPISAGLEVRS